MFSSGDDAHRLDAVRTASSLFLGVGAAARRRQQHVEPDHDADEHRVKELYGNAANQLGSDRAPVRLAGVYALERLGQDHPKHRQTIVNLLCSYLRMPYQPGADSQEGLVRGAAQGMLETHLRPATPELFWPDTDLVLTGAVVEYFWFRDCQIREGNFGHVTFHAMAAFRGTRFTGRAYFQNTSFTGAADLRGLTFERATFRDAAFKGDVDFGAEPRPVDLDGATALASAKLGWPAGWTTARDTADELRVVRYSGPDHSTVTWSGS